MGYPIQPSKAMHWEYTPFSDTTSKVRPIWDIVQQFNIAIEAMAHLFR